MPSLTPLSPLPGLVAHADWSTNPKKRWLARAILDKDGLYHALPPVLAGDPVDLIRRLQFEFGDAGPILLGFDFPIGLPYNYAQSAGITGFLDWLPQAGRGEWSQFYSVAETPDQISLGRPFYPQRPGRARQIHLLTALGFEKIDDLRRLCDKGRPDRRAAAPLFWTMGGQQVGKAAMCGWQEVLSPALAKEDISVWPFFGPLAEILKPGQVTIVETYPGEFYGHLGVLFSASRRGQKSGKRSQADRAANAPVFYEWAECAAVSLHPSLQAAISNGFGPTGACEDPFDATVGLFGMLNIVLGHRLPGEPVDDQVRHIEGWILGQTQPA